MTRRQRLALLLKDAGWWLLRSLGLMAFLLLDFIWSVGFAIGVWLLSDLCGYWQAWKWKREQQKSPRIK